MMKPDPEDKELNQQERASLLFNYDQDGNLEPSALDDLSATDLVNLLGEIKCLDLLEIHRKRAEESLLEPTKSLLLNEPTDSLDTGGSGVSSSVGSEHHEPDQLDEESTFAPDPDTWPISDSHSDGGEGRELTMGRYRVGDILGSGGFGIVYHAYDPELEREVALKIPRTEALASSEARARFDRESRAAALLCHPAIVPIYESGNPLKYIAYKYIRGETLANWLTREKTVRDCKVVAKTGAVLAEAIQHAHSKGVLHRDLKPGNLLIETSNDGPVLESELASSIFIADFGLARIEHANDESLTRSSAIIGTPSYMAPEQARGQNESIGPGADIYSLGAILYTMLTGKPPHRKESDIATLQAVTTDPVPPTSRVRDGVPRDLEAIVLKCLEKKPELRYRTAEDLHADLQRFLESRPVVARTITKAEHAYRWTRRNPIISGLIGACVALLVAGTAGSTYFAWQANQRYEEAVAAGEKAVAAGKKAEERAEAEKAARENEAEQRRFTEAISDFVQEDILALATVSDRPRYQQKDSVIEFELSRDSNLSDLLERAALKLDQRSKSLPDAEVIALRDIIGNGLNNLGFHEQARIQFEDAYRLCVKLSGPADSTSIQLANALCYTCFQSGDFKRGFELADDLVTQCERLHGPNHSSTLDAKHSLAYGHFVNGEAAVSVEILESTLDRYLNAPSTQPHHAVHALSSLGAAYARSREVEQGIEKYEQAIELAKREFSQDKLMLYDLESQLASAMVLNGQVAAGLDLLGPAVEDLESGLEFGHPDVISAKISLAETYAFAGRYVDAIETGKSLVDMTTEKFGSTSMRALICKTLLATYYRSNEQIPVAIEIAEETLPVAIESQGDNEVVVFKLKNLLTQAYADANRIDEAIATGQQSLKICEKLPGNNRPYEIEATINLGRAYFAAGDFSKALRSFGTALRNQRKLGRGRFPEATKIITLIAECYRLKGNYAKAIAKNREAIQTLEETGFTEFPEYLAAKGNLAVCYSESGRPEKAVAHLEFAYEESIRLFGDDHPQTLNATGNLAITYLNMSRDEDAVNLFQKLISIYENRDRADDANPLGLHTINLINVYCKLEQFEKAVELGDRVVARLKINPGPEHQTTLRAMHNLAGAKRENGNLQEAAAIFREVLRLKQSNIGEDEPETVITMVSLTATLYDLSVVDGEVTNAELLEEAIGLAKRSIELRTKRFGPYDELTYAANKELAMIYYSTEQWKAAAPVYKKLLEYCHRKLGPEHMSTVNGALLYCVCTLKSGDKDGAIAFLKREIDATPDGKARQGLQKSLEDILNQLLKKAEETGDSEAAEKWERELKDAKSA